MGKVVREREEWDDRPGAKIAGVKVHGKWEREGDWDGDGDRGRDNEGKARGCKASGGGGRG